MNTLTGIYLLLFVGLLCITLIILATEYWGWYE